MSEELKCTCVYATSANTESVRKGYEMGGYLKAECEACKSSATPPSPSTAPTCAECNGTRRIAGPVGDPPSECEACLDQEPPSTASEVGELPPLPPHFGGIDIYHSNGRVEAYDGYTADQMREYGQECARAALAATPAARDQRIVALDAANQQLAQSAQQRHDRAERLGLTPAAREVDVEAERKLFEKEANDARFFPREINFDRIKSPSGRDMVYVNSHLQSRWEGWLAARRTQVPAQTGSGEEGKDGYVLVPVKATKEIIINIEREIDGQLAASGISPVTMQRQDGEYVWDAAIAAAKQKGE